MTSHPVPHILFSFVQPKKGGGLSYNSTVPLTQCSEKLVQLILHEYSILHVITERHDDAAAAAVNPQGRAGTLEQTCDSLPPFLSPSPSLPK